MESQCQFVRLLNLIQLHTVEPCHLLQSLILFVDSFWVDSISSTAIYIRIRIACYDQKMLAKKSRQWRKFTENIPCSWHNLIIFVRIIRIQKMHNPMLWAWKNCYLTSCNWDFWVYEIDWSGANMNAKYCSRVVYAHSQRAIHRKHLCWHAREIWTFPNIKVTH